MRLLIVTPLWHRWQASLDSILAVETVGPTDYLMLADDDQDSDGTLAGNYRNITRKYNHARDVFLSGEYEAMVCFEDDIIVPPDAIKKLLAVDADIVYGLTCWRHGMPVWSARVIHEGHEGTRSKEAVETLGWVLSQEPKRAGKSWGKVIDVVGVGMACTLIRRQVLERLPFRLETGASVCCDWWLAVDARREGFSQKADLGLVTGHIMKSATGEARVLWPTNEGRLWRMTAL